jgi:peptide/nickel transport system substrate-binding protein
MSRTTRQTGARFLLAGAAMLVTLGAVDASARTVTIAMSPVATESNLYWESEGDFIMPSMQSLVGNDPETGRFDTSALAESWEHNEDFTVWTFHLKPEAEFHHGWGNVTSADVLHSFELHTSEDSRLSGISALRAATVTVEDDHTVRFELDSPQPDFPFLHAGRGALTIYSKAQFDAEGIDGYLARPAGTGPFAYVSREVGQHMTFARVQDHWDGIEPGFDELVLRMVGEPATQLAALLTGEADIATLPRELQPQAVGAGYEVLTSTQGAAQVSLLFGNLFTNPEEAEANAHLPWQDIRIREAVNRAIDREQLLAAVYEDRAEPLVVFTMDAPHEGYVPELAERFDDVYGYDPERAKELLAEAGYPEAFADPVIPIWMATLPGNPEFPLILDLVQVFLDEVGFETSMRETDMATILAARRARDAGFLFLNRNAPIRPTQIGLQTFFSHVARPTNVVDDPVVNERFDELRNEVDPERREALAGAIFTHLFESYSHAPLVRIFAEVTVDPNRITGWTFPGSTSSGLSHFHLIELAE